MAKKEQRAVLGFGYKVPAKTSTSKKKPTVKKPTVKKPTVKKPPVKKKSSFTAAATGGSVADFRRGEENSMAGLDPVLSVTSPSVDEQSKFRIMNNIVTPTSGVPVVTSPSATPTPETTSSTGTFSTPVIPALPSSVILARQQYDADRAAAAATRYANEAAIRELFSQGVMGARGGAADIYGGRAPALLGQAVTGVQRDFLVNQAAEEMRNQAALEALRRSYSEAVGTAYGNLGNTALDRANERSALAAQIKRLGMG